MATFILIVALTVLGLTQASMVKRQACESKYSDISPTHTMCKTDVGGDVALSTQEKQDIVDKHNEYRSNVNPTAENLVRLVWDEDIAVIASKFARQCVQGHDDKKDRAVPSLPGVYIGQNSGYNHGSVMAALISWHSEVDYFSHGVGNTSDEDVGHYTQVVGQSAVRIGCGQADCSDGTYQVCNYARGQYTDETVTPYISGSSCTKCPTGKCQNNLCDCGGKVCFNGGTLDSATCTCNCYGMYSGDQCQTGNCPEQDSGYCSTVGDHTPYCEYSWFRDNYCPIRCGLCPAPASCPNGEIKLCQNGATLNQNCECECFKDYSGELCDQLNCATATSDPQYTCTQETDDSGCSKYWNYPYLCPELCGKC